MSKSTITESKKNPIKPLTTDKKIELYNQKITEMYPRLTCQVNLYQEQIILSQNGRHFAFQVNDKLRERLEKLLLMMDGSRSLSEIQEIIYPKNPEAINEIVHNLDRQGFIDDVVQLRVTSGIDALLELEDLTNNLFNKSLKENHFYKAINLTTGDLPINILYGFAIEYYHLFCHNCFLYSPILSFQGSTKIQQLIKELYFQKYGQDELLLAALNTIGITGDKLIETIPLTETMAMCNGLAYWANFDPLFLLSIQGVLAEKTLEAFESYIHFCEQAELDSCFIKMIKQLITTKLNRESESLTRHIFQEIPHINEEMSQRLRRQIYLFVEIYNNFYKAIWNHYSNTSDLLRRIPTI
ncbi:hypothetical protein [Nostoc sp. ChiQUE01b]|uniref:hypothetical protein n=1 Tax=Nostoc sp. ChiQUE01b TaxID=3075376 RepID=UPI002AD31525|nr:hypothetical protein [Nostoc sp. ChiQUE01b]MDZ8262455.1 hypothetical protein [Nostoc sp. ChiQUE01b]